MRRPLILISNDDGYEAKGLRELVGMVRDLGDIIVCAPEGPRSGRSRAFSTEPITLRPLEREASASREARGADAHTLPQAEWHVCSGTPVDCVKMAWALLCPHHPDLILGGINHGDNASTNAHYSGTVGVATEGALKGVPSVAFSLCDYSADADFRPMERIVRAVTRRVLSEGLPPYTFLNVNVPVPLRDPSPEALSYCRMARGGWINEVEEAGMNDAEGRPMYRMLGEYRCDEPLAEDTDRWALAHGLAAITPCTIDLTAGNFFRS